MCILVWTVALRGLRPLHAQNLARLQGTKGPFTLRAVRSGKNTRGHAQILNTPQPTFRNSPQHSAEARKTCGELRRVAECRVKHSAQIVETWLANLRLVLT